MTKGLILSCKPGMWGEGSRAWDESCPPLSREIVVRASLIQGHGERGTCGYLGMRNGQGGNRETFFSDTKAQSLFFTHRAIGSCFPVMHVPLNLRDTVEAATLGVAGWNRADLISAALSRQTLDPRYPV